MVSRSSVSNKINIPPLVVDVIFPPEARFEATTPSFEIFLKFSATFRLHFEGNADFSSQGRS